MANNVGRMTLVITHTRVKNKFLGKTFTLTIEEATKRDVIDSIGSIAPWDTFTLEYDNTSFHEKEEA